MVKIGPLAKLGLSHPLYMCVIDQCATAKVFHISVAAGKRKKAGTAKKVAVENPPRKNTGRRSKKVVAKPKKK